ncbi:hypothetical protein LWI28_000450 [Acer negundo]|uniref:Uncharacterized protein n=1 Tax=Acer negundo TaxID=4023 RepID=A0AAD5IXX4_ACENE|nr:hypothetical protein LWI28_000450 [Acer negundo]
MINARLFPRLFALSDVDVVCDAQTRKAKSIAEASHRDSAEQEVSGIAPPLDYKDIDDEGSFEESLEGPIAQNPPKGQGRKCIESTLE